MKFLVISHVLHKSHQNQIWGYGPYIREMNIWEKHIDHLIIVAPIMTAEPSPIDLPYISEKITFFEVPSFNLVGSQNIIKSFFRIPGILFNIFKAMREADHIHLRCPGNMGLLGSIVQIVFPKVKKTAKYAGNWDWNSKQPWTYRLQQWILRNTFLTRNMKVLVYGEWPDRNRNIWPFFTASYFENEQVDVIKPAIECGINLIFAGSLTKNKRPILALEVLKGLIEVGEKAKLVFCGEGSEKEILQEYTSKYELESYVKFLGNVTAEVVKTEFQNSHFLIFGSRSEGWPKVVAEAMWWGCVPITTSVSCVPQMLGNGQRGIICDPVAEKMIQRILNLIRTPEILGLMVNEATKWSREFTIEKLESELIKLIKQ